LLFYRNIALAVRVILHAIDVLGGSEPGASRLAFSLGHSIWDFRFGPPTRTRRTFLLPSTQRNSSLDQAPAKVARSDGQCCASDEPGLHRPESSWTRRLQERPEGSWRCRRSAVRFGAQCPLVRNLTCKTGGCRTQRTPSSSPVSRRIPATARALSPLHGPPAYGHARRRRRDRLPRSRDSKVLPVSGSKAVDRLQAEGFGFSPGRRRGGHHQVAREGRSPAYDRPPLRRRSGHQRPHRARRYHFRATLPASPCASRRDLASTLPHSSPPSAWTSESSGTMSASRPASNSSPASCDARK